MIITMALADESMAMCCTYKVPVPKWVADCPTMEQSECELPRANRCKWVECSAIGYCVGIKTGRNNRISNLCARQTNRPKCVNKVFAGSLACNWHYGSPPEDYFSGLDVDDLDEDELDLRRIDIGDLEADHEKEESEFVVDSQSRTAAESVTYGIVRIHSYSYLLIGFICICCVGSWAIYSNLFSKQKHDEQNVQENRPLLSEEA